MKKGLTLFKVITKEHYLKLVSKTSKPQTQYYLVDFFLLRNTNNNELPHLFTIIINYNPCTSTLCSIYMVYVFFPFNIHSINWFIRLPSTLSVQQIWKNHIKTSYPCEKWQRRNLLSFFDKKQTQKKCKSKTKNSK